MTSQSNSIPLTSMSRRRLFTMLGLGGIAAAGCAGPGSTGSSDKPAAAEGIATGPAEGDVSFAHWRAEDQKIFDQLIASFVAANAGVKVTQNISTSNDYQSSALQQIRGGKLGDAFVSFRGAQFLDMVKAGIYAKLSGQGLVESYEPTLIQAGSQDGTQFGLPYQLVFNMPLANMDALTAAGVSEAPKDWDGFLAMCEALQGKGLTPIAWPGGDVGNAGQLLNTMVMNNGPSDDMFAGIESGEFKVTDDWFLTTLKQYAQLAPFFQPQSTGTAVEPAQQLFATGKAGLLATGSFHMAAVRGLGATFPIDFVAPITTTADKAKYEGVHNATFILGVNTASDVQPAALAFVKFLSDPANAGAYANGTSQHVTVKGVTYDNPDLEATSGWLTRKTLLAPRFQFTDLDIRNAVEATSVQVVGGMAPEQAADAAQRIIDQRIAAS